MERFNLRLRLVQQIANTLVYSRFLLLCDLRDVLRELGLDLSQLLVKVVLTHKVVKCVACAFRETPDRQSAVNLSLLSKGLLAFSHSIGRFEQQGRGLVWVCVLADELFVGL